MLLSQNKARSLRDRQRLTTHQRLYRGSNFASYRFGGYRRGRAVALDGKGQRQTTTDSHIFSAEMVTRVCVRPRPSNALGLLLHLDRRSHSAATIALSSAVEHVTSVYERGTLHARHSK